MKTKAHIIYKLKDEITRIPGVTTITAQLGWNTRVLVGWANRMGLMGIDTTKYVDDKADIGTLAHSIITDKLSGKKTDFSDYSKKQIDRAINSALSYYNWEAQHKVEPILVETPQVSEKYKYGGTPDFYGRVDEVLEIVDFKTGSDIYKEYFVQTAGYWKLLQVNGYPVERVRILNIPRVETENFQDMIVGGIEYYWRIFLNCLDTYYTLKKIKAENYVPKEVK